MHHQLLSFCLGIGLSSKFGSTVSTVVLELPFFPVLPPQFPALGFEELAGILHVRVREFAQKLALCFLAERGLLFGR
jgi:hypothetical protein